MSIDYFDRRASAFDPELLKSFEMIKQGAEAKLYKGTYEQKDVIVKERFKKSYRHPDLDKALTSKRIKIETKMLVKASTIGVQVPAVHKTFLSHGIIMMQYIDESITCREFFVNIQRALLSSEEEANKSAQEALDETSRLIGEAIGKLHRNQIIHGDLTTSNMLIKKSETRPSSVWLIDFGLSNVSGQLEDKAVDLYVLERALLSTHSTQAARIFENILKGYAHEHGETTKQVIDKLDQVRLRGRKRDMIG